MFSPTLILLAEMSRIMVNESDNSNFFIKFQIWKEKSVSHYEVWFFVEGFCNCLFLTTGVILEARCTSVVGLLLARMRPCVWFQLWEKKKKRLLLMVCWTFYHELMLDSINTDLCTCWDNLQLFSFIRCSTKLYRFAKVKPTWCSWNRTNLGWSLKNIAGAFFLILFIISTYVLNEVDLQFSFFIIPLCSFHYINLEKLEYVLVS